MRQVMIHNALSGTLAHRAPYPVLPPFVLVLLMLVSFGCSTLSVQQFRSAPLPGLAPSGSTLYGKLMDRKGEPWIGVMVTLVSPQHRAAGGAATDVQGTFTISNVPAGTYEIVFESVEGKERLRHITIAANSSASITVTLAFRGIPGIWGCPPASIDPRSTSTGAHITSRNGEPEVHYY